MDQTNGPKKLAFAIVSETEAKSVPYPYVYVNEDGTVRELHPDERSYLETPFHPFDSGQPYTKNSYQKKDGRGRISGFCLRSHIPSNIDILDTPTENPST